MSSTQTSHQHERVVGEDHSVTPLELFFDLVFVFALTQVTTLLADDLTWVGMLRGFAVLAVVWWAWVGYSWLTNSIRIDDDIASRLVIMLAMAAMLVAGLAAPAAFGEYAVLFGVAYFVVRDPARPAVRGHDAQRSARCSAPCCGSRPGC